MSHDTEHGQRRLTRRVLPALVAVLSVVIAPLAFSLGSSAFADTTGTPDTNTRAAISPTVASASVGTTAPGTLSNLVGGNIVTIHVDGQAGKFNGIQSIRQCRSGLTITNASGMSPSTFGNCSAAGLPGGDSVLSPTPSDASATFVDVTFKVGQGTEASHSGPGAAITCDASNPCALWIQESVDTSISGSGFLFKHYDLTYAGPLSAPTSPTGSGGNTTATFTWGPPASLGGGTLNNYTVTLDNGGGTQTVAGTSATFTGLTNFTTYTATIVANTTAGTSPAATATATPGPGGVTGLAAAGGDHQVTLSWNPPAGPAPTSYEVAVTPAPAAPTGPGPFTTAGSPYTVLDLTNGTVYTFTVRAFYGGTNFGQPSSVSATPNGTLVTQHIYVSRPQGSLVLTQVCGTGAGFNNTSAAPYQNGNNPTTAPVAPGTSPTPGNSSSAVGTADPNFSGYPYAQDPNTGLALAIYPTDCRVDLGTAKLITSGAGAGQYFQADGAIDQITVVDARDTDPGWTVNGRTSSFTSGVNTFSGDDLGWTPHVTSTTPGFSSPDGSYLQVVSQGSAVAPGTAAANGLAKAARTLAFANAKASVGGDPTNNTGGLGIAQLDGALHLLIPIVAIHGIYVSVLTITAA